MKRTKYHLLPWLALAGLLAVPALADDSETQGAEAPDMEAAMAAMQKAAAPGEHHEFLASLAGDWTFTSRVWMEPGQPPSESKGESTKTTILGGRFLQEAVTGEMMGTTFNGRGVTGYDNTAGEYVNTWIDDMTTTVAIAKGQRDGNALEMHGEYLDPMSGLTMKTRYVTRVVDADTHVFEYYMTMPEAEEFKSMEITYSRKGSE